MLLHNFLPVNNVAPRSATAPSRQRVVLNEWQVALLRSIWRRPTLWVADHPDVLELRRWNLVSAHGVCLSLTTTGLSVLQRYAADQPVA